MQKYLNLKNIIYLTIFFLPSYLIKFNFFGLPINFLEILIAIVFFAWLFSKKQEDNFKNFFQKNKTLIILIAFIFLGFLTSAFFNKIDKVSLGIIKSWFLIPVFFTFICWQTIKKEELEKIFKAYLFSGVFVSILAILYWTFGEKTFDGRTQAFFNSPNYLAMYLSPALFIAIEKLKNKTNYPKKSLLFASLVIISLTLYLTFSYTAWFSIILSVLFISLAKNKNVRFLDFKKISLLILIILIVFFSQLSNPKMKNILSPNSNSSLSSRIAIWKSSLKIISDNYFWGIGAGKFQEKYLDYQKFYPPYPEWAVPHPHNIFLSFWLYSGIIGLMSFLGLLLFWFKNIFEKINQKKEPLLFVALGIMLIILIHGLFDTTYFKNDLAIIFWINFLALKI
jgi:O-antigen ligase